MWIKSFSRASYFPRKNFIVRDNFDSKTEKLHNIFFINFRNCFYLKLFRLKEENGKLKNWSTSLFLQFYNWLYVGGIITTTFNKFTL